MNIMLFSRICAKTGVGNHIKQLGEELVREGHKVIVVSGTMEQELSEEVKFIKVPILTNNPLDIFKCVTQLRKIVKIHSIDVVHCHHRKASLIMRFYRCFYPIPVVYTLHLANIPCDFWHRILTFVGDKAIAISGEVREFLIKELKIPSYKIVTVYNGVKKIRRDQSANDIIEQKRDWNIPENRYVIVMHSRIDRVKNHLHMVEVVKGLSEEARRKIVVVSSGKTGGRYYNEIISKIKEYGLDENFRFVGWVETEKILSIADFLFLPSFNEGFPLSVIEAFMMKVPVARTETSGFKEQKYCLPISAYDTKDSIEILENLVANGRTQYESRINEAYELAMSDFTIEAMVTNTVKVYEEVCFGKSITN